MQTQIQTSLDAPGASAAAIPTTLRNAVHRLLARLAAALQARRNRAALLEMDERMLEDIGLTRAHASRAAPSTALRDLYR